jgi:glycosyltransferase involved in cell wall biosynthesis
VKVAIVYDFFPHYRRAVMQALDRQGRHTYEFVGANRALRGGIEAVAASDVAVFRSTPGFYFRGIFVQLGLLRSLLRRDIDGAIFLANPYFLSTWVAALMCRIAGKWVLFWTHGWLQRESGVKRFIRLAFYKLSHGLLLYGERAREIAIMEGFSPAELHVIYNSLDFDRQVKLREKMSPLDRLNARRRFFSEPELPMVVCCARLIPACRFDLLIEALAALGKDGVAVNALLIGDGPERCALERLADERGVRLAFAGACYDEETLCRWIAAADCTVSPGKVGLTAMQSLAFGVPVITHDDLGSQMPEVEVIVPGVNGDLFRKDDAADLAATIRRWIWRQDGKQVAYTCASSLVPRYTPSGQVVEIERAINATAARRGGTR